MIGVGYLKEYVKAYLNYGEVKITKMSHGTSPPKSSEKIVVWFFTVNIIILIFYEIYHDLMVTVWRSVALIQHALIYEILCIRNTQIEVWGCTYTAYIFCHLYFKF